jgi:16S rRNA (guanine1516-N2)-methyltransferase
MEQRRMVVVIESEWPERRAAGEALAAELGLMAVRGADEEAGGGGGGGQLVVTDERVELRLGEAEVGMRMGPVWVDFVGGAVGYRMRRGAEHGGLLGRAVGLRGRGRGRSGEAGEMRVLDATVGLGRDAFMLAGMGCRVVGVERCGAVWALVMDGLRRAGMVEETAEIAGRVEVRRGDAAEGMEGLVREVGPGVIYVDPMFPERRKSAAVKKEMVACRWVAGEDEDAEALLAAALATGVHRVVVKRPAHAERIGRVEPSVVMKGEAVRYDVYVKA